MTKRFEYFTPSAKGLAAGLKSTDRIIFVDHHYVWFNETSQGFSYNPVGVMADKPVEIFEHKPGLSRPDSLWKKSTGTIDPNKIKYRFLIIEKTAPKNLIKKLGLTFSDCEVQLASA